MLATMQKGKWRHFTFILIPMAMFMQGSHGTSEGQLSLYLREVFRDESGRELNQMVVSNESGSDFVYVGGMTMLYQLDMDLTLLRDESTAPDSDPCPPPCLYSTKILEVAPSPIGKLIQCGGPEGKCELRSLTDISRDFGYTILPVVNDGMSVGVVAVREDVEGLGQVFMYVATSIGADLSSNVHLPITHRTLDHPSNPILIFDYSAAIERITTAGVDYIQGVSWNNSNFWIVHSGSEQSRLGRICSNTTQDELDAYTEITLSCESHNILKSVHIDMNDILYGVFTNGTNSVLCSYTMSEIQERFVDAICGCVIHDDLSCTGQGQLSSYLEDSGCYPDSNSGETRESLEADHQCDSVSRFKYVEATSPLFGNLLAADLPGQHSSIITLNKGDEVIALVTTSTTSYATLSKVMKLAVINCSQYTTCRECLGPTNETRDPFCGWCTSETKCSRSSECPNGDVDSPWLLKNQDCIDPPTTQEIDSPTQTTNQQQQQTNNLDTTQDSSRCSQVYSNYLNLLSMLSIAWLCLHVLSF